MESLAGRPLALRRRLLQDIASVQQDAYPNVFLFPNDADLTHACLILTPPEGSPLHLSIDFREDYPLSAPHVTIQSAVEHPNVFNDYICASMLNTEEGWTPAYTLQGILIQLLSFFCSDSLEQEEGGVTRLKDYGHRSCNCSACRPMEDRFQCEACGFHSRWTPPETVEGMRTPLPGPSRMLSGHQGQAPPKKRSKLFELPDEIILRLMNFADDVDLISLGEAVPTLKSMLRGYDIIRLRELQCFCLKKSYLSTKLGIGVSVTGGRRPLYRSEFDLLSIEAYSEFNVRKSIHGVDFDHWLPLPLSNGHWKKVRGDAASALTDLRQLARENMSGHHPVEVLYHFMNTIVVQFSSEAARSFDQPDARSTLTHASEKAVDSYFALFHLLLCLATEEPAIVRAANEAVTRFIAGPRSKAQFPDLGHVLAAALVSDDGISEDLSFWVIKEAILRNVVWMLDSKGANKAELAYLEPESVSDYRLSKTFEASRTSYRLLMFLKLFSSTAREPGKSLIELRDGLFDTHGAPPHGTSTAMAREIRKIREINDFPSFLTAMGIEDMPTEEEFLDFLKRTITDSVRAGYSSMPLDQSQLYMIRQKYEPHVGVSYEVDISPSLERWYEREEKWSDRSDTNRRPSFFPNRGSSGGGRGGRFRRGRGRR